MNQTNRIPWKRNAQLFGGIILISFIIVSCDIIFNLPDDSSEQVTYNLTASHFPEDSGGCNLLVQALKKEDGYWNALDEYKFGTASPTATLTRTVSIDASSTIIGFYIMDSSGEEKYFFTRLRKDIIGDTLSVNYWVDYPCFDDYERVRYGIHRSAVQPLPLETYRTFEFNDEPYYLFEEDSAAGRSFRITVERQLGDLSVLMSNQLSSLATRQGTELSSYEYLTVKDFSPTADPLYLLVAPYDIQIPTKANIMLNDLSGELDMLTSHSFSTTNALTLDGNVVYLVDIDNSYVSGKTPAERYILKKWTISTNAIEDAHTFDSTVSAWALDGTTLYIASGKKVHKLDLNTNAAALFVEMDDYVESLALINDKLLVFDDEYHLVNKSDGSTLASSTSYYGGKTTIWIPSQNRIYFYRDGLSPSDIGYLELDPDTNTFGTYGDSPYHGDYSLTYPLIQLGDALSLVTGSGNIFSIDDSSESKILYQRDLGFKVKDMVVKSDRILVLSDFYSPSNKLIGCRVITLSPDSPYGETSRTSLMKNESGVALLNTSTEIIAVTKSCENIKIADESYNPVKIRKLTAGNLAGTASLTNRASSNSGSKTWTLTDGPSRPAARGQ